MKRSLFVALAALVACDVPRTPVVTPAPPPGLTIQLNVSVYDEAGAPVTDAKGHIEFDRDAGEGPVSADAEGWRESFTVQAPPVHVGWGANLLVTSPNYLPSLTRVTVTGGELPTVVLKSVHTWGDETGRLKRAGIRITTEDGRDWRYRGFTAFTYLQKFCDGEDLDPLIEDAASTGARVFRVLGMYQPWIGTFRLAVDNPAQYDRCLIDFVREFASHGLRVQFVVFADAQNVMPDHAVQEAWFAHVAALLANEWNVIGELCNECSKNGVDPQQFQRPPPSAVLWSRGSGLAAEDPSHNPWDLTDYHEARDEEYPRKNECREYQNNSNSPVRGWPCLQSEPMGASEGKQDGKREGAVPGDPSSSERAINRFGWMGMNFGLQNAGGLFHSDAGITGGPLGPLQRQMAVAFFRGLNLAPAAAHTWPYQRGDNCGNCDGIGGMPLEQLDAIELRVFCRTSGDAWCVDIPANDAPRLLRAPIPRAGWRVAEEAAPGLLRLSR